MSVYTVVSVNPSLIPILWAHYKLYEFPLIFLTLTNSTYSNVYVRYYLKSILTTCSASFSFSSDTT